ncbi:hypothetical protein BYT27DRAFT_7218652 [Phlegmacium glaucopus]|nr:hypothetical protein BYT27DRAFT_7218652 [Phlegmacium glaucopus]
MIHPDTEYLVRQAMTTGYQWSSLLVPPVYIAYVLARRGQAALSTNRVLRATWVGGLGGKSAWAIASGGVGYLRYANLNQESVRMKRLKVVYDSNVLRRNDHSTIGGILGAVLIPAILWKRASIVNLILGGAGLGSGIGLLTHYGRTITGDSPQVEVIALPEPTS